jgi:uncharacterized Zn finger protein
MKDPICPHCKEIYDIDHNESYNLYSDEEIHEVDCNICEKTFFVKTHTSYSFTTDIDEDFL